MTTKVVGGPTKYKPEYCERVQKHMAKGYSFESFAAGIDVDRQTLYDWYAVYPDFKKAKARGDEKSLIALECMYVSAKETGKGNVKGALFMLQNRFPNEWGNKKKQAARIKKLTLD